MAHDIHLARVRNACEIRPEPYFATPIETGLFVGYRRVDANGGNWIARFYTDDKRQVYKSLGRVSETFDFGDARKAARAWRKQVEAGVQASDIRTVEQACREYVKDRRKHKGEAAGHDAELRFLRSVYTRPLGASPLAKVTTARLEAWRNELAAPDEDGKALSKSTLNRELTSLKAALNYAAACRYVDRARKIEWESVKPHKDAGRRRDLFLDLSQRRALHAAAQGAVQDLIGGVMLTGSRAGELTSALRKQFDERTGSATLRGKTGPRTVPLAPAAIALFARLAKSKLPNAHLFTRDDGKAWAPSDWDKLVRQAAARAELPAGVCLYTLRHSFITEAIQGGMTPLEVARLVGTSLIMIDKHYGHLAPTAAKERLARVNLL